MSKKAIKKSERKNKIARNIRRKRQEDARAKAEVTS
jgi:hypothetical protein